MNNLLIPGIAKSLLLARWRQTLIAAIGVMFSITMFISLLGFMGGLNELLDGLLLNRTAHVRLYNEIRPNEDQPVNRVGEYQHGYNFIRSVKSTNARQNIYNSAAIIRALKTDSRVQGIAPKITTPVFFNNVAEDIAGVLNGISLSSEVALFHFNDFIISGELADVELVSNSVVLGKGLAEILSVDIGDRVQVAIPGGAVFPLKVVALYQSGIDEIDKSQSFASLATVQKLMQKPATFVTDIQVKLVDVDLAPVVAKEFSQLFDIDAIDIQTANAQFETGSFIRTLISYAVGIVLLVVAGFGIYNILNMMIYEKMATLAILKATGFAGKDVKKIFLLIATSIGLSGGIVGLGFGFGLSVLIDQIPFNTASLPTIRTYPVSYNPAFYLIGFLFSLLTTFLAGWLPARKASKIDPVIILRGK